MLFGRVLGPTEVESDGLRVDLGGPLPRRLVTALLAAEGRTVGEDALAETIWAGAPPASFSVSLQAYVSRLRRAFGGEREALERSGDGYRLAVAETDAVRFAAGVGRGRELLAADRPGEALRAFDAALGLWRGEAYADLTDAAAPLRARLAELRSVAHEERLAALLAVGDAPGAVGELESAVRAEPYRERRWELLIVALYRSGRQADSLAALRRVRARLADDLGIDPGPALQDLEARLLAQDPALLLPAGRKPLNRPLSSFLGRRAELALLADLATSRRLVTLVGPGGAGKTRLAVEYAADAHPWFVRLADIADPDLVPAAVAEAAGVKGSALTAALADRHGLLVLDNCEHLVDAVADLVLELLAACPSVRVLATSREPLGVDGEHLLPVAPLPAADAVDLLTDRIAAIRPGWRPDAAESGQLARLATALDGIPLALELAAARARVLGLGELLDMLDDRFTALGPVPRGALAPHDTLEAAIAWSVDLLSAGDRVLLLRLWPFEGGFPLAAADADLGALSSLVARSVVSADTTVTPSRYRLLEIVRAYCRSRDPDPAASRSQHAAWVRDLVERVAPELRGPRSAHGIRVLNRELANLRTGIAHDLAAAPHAALRTAGLLEWFWYRGGHVSDGVRLLRAALAGAPDAPAIDRSRAYLTMATLFFLTGDAEPAIEHLRRGIDLLDGTADTEGLILRAQAHYYESLLRTALADYAAGAARARDAMAVARRIGEVRLVAAGAMTLGWAQAGAGEIEAGRRTLAEAIETAASIDQHWTRAMSEMLLARCLLRESPDPAAALAMLRLAVARFVDEDDVGNVLSCLQTGALALTLSGRVAEGATLAAAVRRHEVRRGLDVAAGDPIGSAALAAALTGVDRPVEDLDEAGMIALLGDVAG